MNKEDWDFVKQQLELPHRSVDMICDGYEITLVLSQTSQFRNAISVYINGWFKGEWILTDCEERRRFYCKNERNVYKKKEIKYVKKFGKKELAKLGIDLDRKYTFYTSLWHSFSRLKSHLIANNKEIILKRRNS